MGGGDAGERREGGGRASSAPAARALALRARACALPLSRPLLRRSRSCRLTRAPGPAFALAPPSLTRAHISRFNPSGCTRSRSLPGPGATLAACIRVPRCPARGRLRLGASLDDSAARLTASRARCTRARKGRIGRGGRGGVIGGPGGPGGPEMPGAPLCPLLPTATGGVRSVSGAGADLGRGWGTPPTCKQDRWGMASALVLMKCRKHIQIPPSPFWPFSPFSPLAPCA